MKIKDQVVCQKIASEMEELGAKQDAWVSWLYYSHEDLYGLSEEEISKDIEFEWGLDCQLCHMVDYIKKYSAFSVAELGEILPEGHFSQKQGGSWACANSDNTLAVSNIYDCNSVYTEADARAKMWIWLKKEEMKE